MRQAREEDLNRLRMAMAQFSLVAKNQETERRCLTTLAAMAERLEKDQTVAV